MTKKTLRVRSRLKVQGSRGPSTSTLEPRTLNRRSKYIYAFGGGRADGRADMKQLLGGKGANLAEMTNLGVPVPPGFTITTDVCRAFYELEDRVDRQAQLLLRVLRKVDPLLRLDECFVVGDE